MRDDDDDGGRADALYDQYKDNQVFSYFNRVDVDRALLTPTEQLPLLLKEGGIISEIVQARLAGTSFKVIKEGFVGQNSTEHYRVHVGEIPYRTTWLSIYWPREGWKPVCPRHHSNGKSYNCWEDYKIPTPECGVEKRRY